MNRFVLFDHIPIGLLVLQADYTVVFWNSCLEEWTGIAKDTIIGTDVREKFPHLRQLIYATRLQEVFGGGPPVVFSSQLHKYIIPVQLRDGQFQIQHTIVTSIPASENNGFFALFAIQDVTALTLRLQEHRAMRDQALQQALETKRAQEAEYQQRVLAEAMRDITATLSNTLNVDEVLDRILANIGRVISYTMVDIMLVENGKARVVRNQYSAKASDHPSTLGLELPIESTPNLYQMATTNQPLIIADTLEFPGWSDFPATRWIRSYAGAPILVRGDLIGFLSLSSHVPNFFLAEQTDLLQTFAEQAAVAVDNARLYSEVQRTAITDELTGVYNRRGLFEIGEREVSRALRFKHPLTAIMFDIDHFKQVNDCYGHPNGDRVLHALAQTCHANIRMVDIVARYGGEEFVVLLPETDGHAGAQTAERIRHAIAQQKTLLADGNSISVTVSLGVADISTGVSDLHTLLHNADRAQYRAKQNGRNQVAIFL